MATEDDNLQPVREEDLLVPPLPYLEVEQDIPMSDDPAPAPSGPDEKSEFDQRYRQPFTGLVFLGELSEEVNVFGHSFLLKTPSQNERLESGLVHKKYLNSISSQLAWAAVTVAVYLRSVDGTALPEPIGPKDTAVQDRFNWVVNNIRGPVIQKLFERCLELDAQVAAIIEELERLGES